ncbi:hypothetical protein C0J50_0144, partial [Silurus asotus]
WFCFGAGKVPESEPTSPIPHFQHHAVPSGLQFIGTDFTVQQGDEPVGVISRANSRLDLERPAPSPPLSLQSLHPSPTELLWDELDHKKKTPTSEEQLWQVFDLDVWRN